MKIALIAPSPVPFTIGGAEKLWWGMLQQINQHSHHEAELIKVPSAERNFSELMHSYHTFFKLDLSHFDCVISTKYPAWMVGHHNHICYLQHRLRGLYDTYHLTGQPDEIHWPDYHGELHWLQPLLAKPQPERTDAAQLFEQLLPIMDNDYLEWELRFPGPLTRAIVHFLDRVALNTSQIKDFFAISDNVRQRQDYFPAQAQVQVIHHPSDLSHFESLAYQSVFTVSRLDKAKRIHLLIEAFKRVRTERPFYIAGSGPDEAELKQLAADDPRIVFLGRQTDDEIIQHYSQALFVPFIPYDEDYGLITIEAMMSAKAVLTCDDSGGVQEFLRGPVEPEADESRPVQNGLSVPLSVEALAGAMQQMLDQPEQTQQWGQNALQAVSHISWEKTLAPLLAAALQPAPVQQSLWPTRRWRPQVVIPTLFSLFPVQGGGQARMFHLYKRLARYCDVTLLGFSYQPEDRLLAPGLREVLLPVAREQRLHLDKIYRALQADVEDIAAIDGILLNTFYMHRLAQLCQQADWLIASHPYLYRAIEQCWQGPVLFDAHNVELLLKQSALQHAGAEAEIHLDALAAVERACYHKSALVFACSQQDLEQMAHLYGRRQGTEAVIANGVDCQAVPFIELTMRQSIRQRLGLPDTVRPMLFVGSAHGPNVEAVLEMIALAEQLPEQLFWVVGSVCQHQRIQQKQQQGELPANVFLFGLVSEQEKQTLMSAAGLALNPMSSGSGSNLKMLDYAANGLPVLTTVFGNRGIEFCHGIDALVAEKENFVATIKQVLSEKESRLQPMANRAREVVEQSFDWDVLCERLWSKIKSS